MAHARADAEKDFMGLMAFAGEQPTLKEAKIAKNYLNEKERHAMGQLVSGLSGMVQLPTIRHGKSRG